MILLGLMFLCAFALSSAAAFYSIVGLMAIFAAAPMPIAIMGSILEVSKLVIASWLYRNWKPIPKLMKGYLTGALVILMFLTSMGIFGFLSKAHLDQGVPTGDIAAKVALLEEKINTEKENINVARTTIRQLDSQVNETLGRSTDESGAVRSAALRRSQQKERAKLAAEIDTAQARIAKLNEEKAPIAAELRKVEAEVGPIKYIAQLIYGQEAGTDSSLLEKAVQWVTILIVAVFDPLAVIMLIAANWTLLHSKREEQPQEPAEVVEEVIEQEPLPVDDQPTEPVEQVEEPAEDPLKNIEKLVSECEDTVNKWQIKEPPAPETTEHPVFQPDSEYWGSRPPNHLAPHNPRKE